MLETTPSYLASEFWLLLKSSVTRLIYSLILRFKCLEDLGRYHQWMKWARWGLGIFESLCLLARQLFRSLLSGYVTKVARSSDIQEKLEL